jgi:LysM repeat protein
MLHPDRIAAALIAASLTGCSSYALLEGDTTASFNQSGKPDWARSLEPAPAVEAPQTIDGLMASTEFAHTEPAEFARKPHPIEPDGKPDTAVASRPPARNSLFAAANPFDAKPIDTPKRFEAPRPSAAVRPAEPPPTGAQTVPPPPIERPRIEPRGHAYLFRGVGGLIYSRGMDKLADDINRTGVKASVSTYLTWRVAADDAIRAYRKDKSPITVIGHSAGGDSALAFAWQLNRSGVPVSLVVTYDPTRMASDVPPNVARFINVYQSRNIMGGGDVSPGREFRGHFASINLKDHGEIVHINIEKAERIHEQLVRKIAELAATPTDTQGDAVPIRVVVPARAAINLWDSGTPVTAAPGDTLPSLAAAHRVPVWALAQVNRLSEGSRIKPGQRIVIPRHLTPTAQPAEIPVSRLGPNR